MNARTRSLLILGATLAIGVGLGAVLTGALAEARSRRVGELRRPMGFAHHMETVIAPRDEAQRDAIRPILSAAGAKNDATIRAAHQELRRSIEEMRATLAPLLDEEQRRRLEEVTSRLPDPFRPPPPGGGRRGGPPPR